MSSIREIKERINSIQNTLKITNAMYMISSTKLNNARKSLAETEPYYHALQSLFARVLRHLPADYTHPYLEDHSAQAEDFNPRKAVICVTADKGLAGAYNHNVLKMVEKKIRPDFNDMLYVVGEVGRQYFYHHDVNVDGEFLYTAQKPTLARARAISEEMLTMYRNKEIDEVFLIYTEMKNSMECETQMIQLLPLQFLDAELFDARHSEEVGMEKEKISLEPDPDSLMNNIIPELVNGYIYSALVESYCAEHNSRMQAMDSANKNGEKLLGELSIRYNRERQAQITQEITEVAAGAKARARQLEIQKKRMRKQEESKEALPVETE